MELFCKKIVSGLQTSTVFAKKVHLRYMTGFWMCLFIFRYYNTCFHCLKNWIPLAQMIFFSYNTFLFSIISFWKILYFSTKFNSFTSHCERKYQEMQGSQVFQRNLFLQRQKQIENHRKWASIWTDQELINLI